MRACTIALLWVLVVVTILGCLVGFILGGIGAHNYKNERAALDTHISTNCTCTSYHIFDLQFCTVDEDGVETCETRYYTTFTVAYNLTGDGYTMVNGSVDEYQDDFSSNRAARDYVEYICLPIGLKINPCWYDSTNMTSVRYHEPSLQFGTLFTSVGFGIVGFFAVLWATIVAVYFVHKHCKQRPPPLSASYEFPAGLLQK